MTNWTGGTVPPVHYFPRIMEKTSCGGILGRTAGTVIPVHRRGSEPGAYRGGTVIPVHRRGVPCRHNSNAGRTVACAPWYALAGVFIPADSV